MSVLLLFLWCQFCKAMKRIFNNILHKFKEDSLTKRTDVLRRTVEFRNPAKVRTCLVFWVANEQQEAWLEKLESHFDDRVKCDRLCFMPQQVVMPLVKNTVYIKNEDLGFGGKIQNDDLMGILSMNYDWLVDLSLETNALIDYALKSSKAQCKLSMKKEGGEADIVIDGIADQTLFIEHLFSTLSGVAEY